MAYKDVVHDMDMDQRFILDIRFLCIKGTMTNTAMPSTTHVKVTPGLVKHTDVAVINVPLIGEERYLGTLIDKTYGHV